MGSIATSAGTFSQVTPAGADLNPYVDAGPWGRVTIGNALIPGIITEISGNRRVEEWAVQRGIATSGAVTVWRGTKLAEAIKILTVLFDKTDVQQHYAMRRVLRPKIGRKPPAHNVVNPAINFSDITRVAVVDVSPPLWNRSDGSWSAEYILIQYSPPKPVAAGTVEPPKATAEDPANVEAEKKLQGLLDRAAKL